MKSETIQIVNTIILAITGFVVWLYTKATQKSNDLRIRPILNLYLREDVNTPSQNPKEWFALRNIGEGTAYNIVLEDIKIQEYVCRFYFKQANIILEPLKDEKEIKFFAKPDGKGIMVVDMMWLKSLFEPQTLQADDIEKAKKEFIVFLVKYKNMAGKNFYSIFKFYTKHPGTSEFIIEFIKSKKGRCSIKKAMKLCITQEKIKSSYGK